MVLLTVLVALSSHQWKNVQIVGGGFVSGIITHPSAKGLVYARTDIGGAYRWDGRKEEWIPLQDWITRKDWNLYGAESLALDPSDPKRVYIAAGTYTNEWGSNGAILRSADQGRTWSRTDMPFKFGGNMDGRSIGERLAVDPHDGRILFLGTRHGELWRSGDYGGSWSAVSSFPKVDAGPQLGTGIVLFDSRSGRKGLPTPRIYAAIVRKEANIFTSADRGITWTEVRGGPQNFIPHHMELGSDGTLFITYGDAPGPNGMSDGAVWKRDALGVWTDISPIRPSEGDRFGYAGLTVQGGVVMVSTMDRWSKGDDIFRSVDGGKSWVSVKAHSERDSSLSPFLNWDRSYPEFGHWIGDVEIDPRNPDHAWYVTGATIWRTDSMRQVDKKAVAKWVVGAKGLEETATIDLACPPSGPLLYSGLGDIGGFRHDDLGVSPRDGLWKDPVISNTDSLDFAERDASIVVRVGRGPAGRSGAVSTDGAKTWRAFSGMPNARSGSVAISSDGKSIVWVPESGMASVSQDLGRTWSACKGLSGPGQVLADRIDSSVFTFIQRNGETVYVSRNGGSTFERSGALPGPARRGRASFAKSGEILIPTSKGLARSRDFGASWAVLPGIHCEAIAYGKGGSVPSLFAIGAVDSREGVYWSTDDGRSWRMVNDARSGFGTMQVIEGDRRVYGRVFVGTNGRGVIYGDLVRR